MVQLYLLGAAPSVYDTGCAPRLKVSCRRARVTFLFVVRRGPPPGVCPRLVQRACQVVLELGPIKEASLWKTDPNMKER